MPSTPEGRLAAAYEHGRGACSTSQAPGPETEDSPVSRYLERMRCPESTGGHDEGSRRDGCCTWCGRKFREKAPRPNLGGSYRDELDLAYRRIYDPDYGTDYWDS